ncbi:hypothetical protein [Pseudalkalibacillus hwajinpoensis]|uniref:Uncharacterized protein n=1 Tax=Guptibacillus hwajinpoensis TaxID=208199 RepID=A0A4U1MM42_9BACL|nr:hypothetical protein [Pseudalkalibacillus hwajinpoensis]TKD71814.1 hypothetical protein FBF83_03155 [Pseudalkalibacillus hwajinpoensis]
MLRHGGVFFIHLCIWFSFFLVIHQSGHDHITYKVMLFFVFLYLICTLTVKLISKNKVILILMSLSTTLYLITELLLIIS